ncbi:hypothetical protein PInf_013661 [Phytophthora infestans]|nr:hypothetical protein PInf_013661 [Phytophthora infestans]
MGDDDLKRAFQALCGDYEELLDERVDLALFKIDEACAAADGLRQDAEQIQEQLLTELLNNCHEFEDIFLRVNLIERFVGWVLVTTRELEKRMESISRAAGPVFNEYQRHQFIPVLLHYASTESRPVGSGSGKAKVNRTIPIGCGLGSSEDDEDEVSDWSDGSGPPIRSSLKRTLSAGHYSFSPDDDADDDDEDPEDSEEA